MLLFTQKAAVDTPANAAISLTFEQRQRSQQRVSLTDGRDAGLKLPRGEPLLPGDRLSADNGVVAQINAASEKLSVVRCDDTHLLARLCYHLGNRHVKLQIGTDELCYQHDHVLDEMVKLLGGTVSTEERPFEPESGAYSDHSTHAHGHGHDHDH